MKKFIYLLIALTVALPVVAQEYTYESPQKLPETINSEAEESKPFLVPDGSKMYFVRTLSPENTGGETAGQDIWYAERTGNGWGQVSNEIDGLNNEENNAVVGIGEGGEKLYLINSYTPMRRRRQGLSISEWKNGQWSQPEELGVEVKLIYNFYDFYITPDESVLLISMSDDQTLGQQDLYVSLRENGRWGKPQHMGSVINSSGFEISPFLSRDKKTLYFASDGFKGKGDADIYKSERLDDSWVNWSAPENLGDSINSRKFDAYYFETPEGLIYFASNRDDRLSDLYQTRKVPVLPEPEVKDTLPVQARDTVKQAPTLKANPAAEELVIIYFAFNSRDLPEEATEKLQIVAQKLEKHRHWMVMVTGHADSMGPEDVNMRYSRDRAVNVQQELIELGVNREQIAVDAKGETAPVADNSTRKGRAENRRVEIAFKNKPLSSAKD